MNIVEMHELFRVLGQQMGMQKVRAILPESIDVLLNTAIVHCVRQVTNSNVTTNFGNIVAVQNNKISVINALRTLYTERETAIADDPDKPNYLEVTEFYPFTIFYLLDCNVTYDEDSPYNYIPARLIEPNLVGEAERDYLLRPTKKYPIATIIEVKENVQDPDSQDSENKGTSIKYKIYSGNTNPTNFKASFIKYPTKVHYDDAEDKCVDCDLPVHFHYMIVEEAVKLYFQSVYATSGSINANSEQQQNNNNR